MEEPCIGNVGRAIVRCSSTYQAALPQSEPASGTQLNGTENDDDDNSSVDSDNPYTYKY